MTASLHEALIDNGGVRISIHPIAFTTAYTGLTIFSDYREALTRDQRRSGRIVISGKWMILLISFILPNQTKSREHPK